MAIWIDTTPELERRLREEAEQRGISLTEYARMLLEIRSLLIPATPAAGEFETVERNPLPLYGIWKDRFPKDMDVDALLREIRGGWLKVEK